MKHTLLKHKRKSLFFMKKVVLLVKTFLVSKNNLFFYSEFCNFLTTKTYDEKVGEFFQKQNIPHFSKHEIKQGKSKIYPFLREKISITLFMLMI